MNNIEIFNEFIRRIEKTENILNRHGTLSYLQMQLRWLEASGYWIKIEKDINIINDKLTSLSAKDHSSMLKDILRFKRLIKDKLKERYYPKNIKESISNIFNANSDTDTIIFSIMMLIRYINKTPSLLSLQEQLVSENFIFSMKDYHSPSVPHTINSGKLKKENILFHGDIFTEYYNRVSTLDQEECMPKILINGFHILTDIKNNNVLITENDSDQIDYIVTEVIPVFINFMYDSVVTNQALKLYTRYFEDLFKVSEILNYMDVQLKYRDDQLEVVGYGIAYVNSKGKVIKDLIKSLVKNHNILTYSNTQLTRSGDLHTYKGQLNKNFIKNYEQNKINIKVELIRDSSSILGNLSFRLVGLKDSIR